MSQSSSAELQGRRDFGRLAAAQVAADDHQLAVAFSVFQCCELHALPSCGACIHAACLTAPFGSATILEHVPLHFVQLLHHLGRAGIDCQFEAVAVRVEEVDRFEDGVIDRADHVDAGRDQALLGGQQFVHRADFHGQVLDPGRGVLVAAHGGWVGSSKKASTLPWPASRNTCM
jgi:hypothetical protein